MTVADAAGRPGDAPSSPQTLIAGLACRRAAHGFAICHFSVTGAAVVLGALYILVGEQLGGTSADAVLNVRLTAIRAPIAGEVTLARRQLGALVADGEALGEIADPLVDTVRLSDLVMEQAFALAEARRLADQMLANDPAMAALRDRSRQYTNERIDQLKARITAARSRAGADEARAEEAGATLSRSDQLKARRFESEATHDRALAAQKATARELQAAEDEVAALGIELSAARRGITLGDGANETGPYPVDVPRTDCYSERIRRDDAPWPS